MKQLIQKYGHLLLTLAFGLVVFWFWAYPYASVLSFQEQFQLFLFDSGYFCERVSVPGGLANYLAGFLTQFYYIPLVGAIILALLFMVIQWLTWRLAKRMGAASWIYPFSFLVPVSVWWFMGDENVMLSFVIALLLSMMFMWGYLWVGKDEGWPARKGAKVAYLVLAIPLMYWCLGPVMLSFVLFVALYEMTKRFSMASFSLAVLTVLYALAIILLASLVVPYPLYRFFSGIGYYRYPVYVPGVQIVVMILISVFPLMMAAFSRKRHWGKWATASSLVLVAVIGFLSVKSAFDPQKYSLIEYDYMLRSKQWNRIISMIGKDQPKLPLSVCATNLALSMTGQLGDRMFDSFQHGSEGLLPDFERNYLSVMVVGEVYYQLGMVNTAQRFAFEAMESLPDYSKSCRAVKRLVETNLINGQYKVAEKYLSMLDRTVFYRKWAERTRPLLGNEEAIGKDPVYGRMRQMRLDEDFLFSEEEKDKMIGQLFLRDSTNTQAMQYLLAFPMLDLDLNRFMQYMEVVQHKANYNPSLCQQAIVMAYASRQQAPPQGVVSPQVLNAFSQFSNIVSSEGPDSPSLEAYRNTFWYYVLKNSRQR